MYKVGNLDAENFHLKRDLRSCEQALYKWRKFWQSPIIEYYFEPDCYPECLTICTTLKTPEGFARGIVGRHRIPKDHNDRMLHSALHQAAQEYGIKIAENFSFEKKKSEPEVEYYRGNCSPFPFPFKSVGG